MLTESFAGWGLAELFERADRWAAGRRWGAAVLRRVQGRWVLTVGVRP